MKRLNKRQLELISQATISKTMRVGIANARKNAPLIKNSIMDIPPAGKRPVMLISAGPSLHAQKSLLAIKNSGFSGITVAVDGTLGHCLRNGIVPDYVLTVDPHPHRIVRWFGDTKFMVRPQDDYFMRQDLDPALNRDEVARNNELIELVNRHGPKIKAIISSSVSHDIALRCIESGMGLYWWNPLYDDFLAPGSFSKMLFRMTKAPCMVTGGNCGTSAWVFSHSVLKSPKVAMVGMDFSYPPGTPVEKTQYFDILKELMPDEPGKGLIKVFNPYLGETWHTDPAYYWYSESFKQMARVAPCKTYNCTEGGILFGRGIVFNRLKTTLKALCRG